MRPPVDWYHALQLGQRYLAEQAHKQGFRVDARDGRFLGIQIPTGQRAGNTFSSWIVALHIASVFGLPWKIAVSLIGIVLVVITVTGVLIWWRKRRGANHTVVHAMPGAPHW